MRPVSSATAMKTPGGVRPRRLWRQRAVRCVGAVLLGTRHENAWRRETAPAVAPAGERFHADNLASGELDDRLIMGLELIASDRFGKVDCERQPFAIFAIHFFIEQARHAAPAAFGAIERYVAATDDFIGVSLIARRHGDADAAADHDRASVEQIGPR